jgi:hypothetical protein
VTLRIDKSLEFVTFWAYADYEPYDAVLARLRKNEVRYILLEGVDDRLMNPVQKKQWRPHTFFVHDLMALIGKKGEDNLPGLALIKKFKIDDRFIYIFELRASMRPR